MWDGQCIHSESHASFPKFQSGVLNPKSKPGIAGDWCSLLLLLLRRLTTSYVPALKAWVLLAVAKAVGTAASNINHQCIALWQHRVG
jgi:hypothetical protein